MAKLSHKDRTLWKAGQSPVTSLLGPHQAISQIGVSPAVKGAWIEAGHELRAISPRDSREQVGKYKCWGYPWTCHVPYRKPP